MKEDVNNARMSVFCPPVPVCPCVVKPVTSKKTIPHLEKTRVAFGLSSANDRARLR